MKWPKIVTLFMIFSLGFMETIAAASMDVAVESCLRKVFPDETDFSPLPRTEARLSLARNEYEPFQVLVAARGGDLKGVSLTVSDLLGPGGASISKSNITINNVAYIPVIRPYYRPNVARKPGARAWPDALRENPQLDVASGQVQPFWITIFAPVDATPGDYTGTITVSSAGAPRKTISLTIRIWDFTLPRTSHLKTAFWLYGRQLVKYHNLKSKQTRAYRDLLKAYRLDMLRHRMCDLEVGINSPCPRPIITRERQDFAAWDEWMEFYIQRGQNFFALPISPEEGKEAIVMKSRAWARHLKEKGWLDMACTFFYDETYRGSEERAWVHQGAPELRNALTNPPDIKKYPNVDIWVPQIGRGYNEYPRHCLEAREAGKELWMYSSSPGDTRFYPNMNMDMPAIYPRLHPWVCWKNKFPGFLYWCVNRWENDPWKTAETYRHQNGNGSLYYPGKTGPVHSIRLESFRDGMEDYEYFYLLREKVEALAKAGKGAEIVARASEILAMDEPDKAWVHSFEKNPERIYEIRSEIAHLIEITEAALQK